MIDWPLAFSAVSQAIKLANELRSIDKEVSEADLKLKIADITLALSDVKLTLAEARSDAVGKDEEIAQLRKLHRRLADDTVELNGYRYRKRTDGQEGGAGKPFCNACLQKGGFLIETTDTNEPGRPLKCPSCTVRYSNVRTYTD